VKRRYDVHVHTTFSPDGRDGLAAYARRVDEGFADGIGFTEHNEFWPGSDACGFLDEQAYLDEVAAWRSKGYDFRAGVEVDWMPAYEVPIRDHLARFPFAYTIASVHNLPSASVSGRDIGWSRGPEFTTVLDEYHAQVASSLKVEAFDVVGHVGVYGRHLGAEFWHSHPLASRMRDLEDNLAALIAQSGKLLEVNTSGLFFARGEPCAGAFLLERYRAYGGQSITLASDAHQAADLRRGFGQAADLLTNLGFNLVFLPWDRENPVRLEDYLD